MTALPTDKTIATTLKIPWKSISIGVRFFINFVPPTGAGGGGVQLSQFFVKRRCDNWTGGFKEPTVREKVAERGFYVFGGTVEGSWVPLQFRWGLGVSSCRTSS
jgi:hypothetical protein